MIGHHVLHALHGAINNPALAASYITRRLKLPYWFRVLLGAVLPPYFNVSKMRSLYVVTYGRSGSTLLTGYLSKLPGCDLKGENYLFPLPLADADERLLAATKLNYGNRHSSASPWYGSHEFSIWRWRRDVRRAILNQLYPTRPIPKTVGFKEIRWWYRMTEKDYQAKLDWLRSIRPPGAIVFLTRDLDKTMAGAWWAEMSDDDRAEARKNLERFEGWVRDYAATHPDHSVHVTYEDFTTSSEPAQRICRMLGLRFDEGKYRETLGERYSYPSKKSD
mgnify:CR=1 FL=1